jgi:hypothetical protein
MRYLSGILFFKIGVTTILWFGPLLFFPAPLLEKIGFPTCPSTIFLKLLGMAYGALLVGYVFGLVDTLHGRYPRSTVWAGIVSNGGAFLLLSMGAFQGVWAAWGEPARIVMWASLAATGLISTGLIAFGPFGRHS